MSINLSQAQYRHKGGRICPACYRETVQISINQLSFEDKEPSTKLFLPMSCQTCSATWDEVFNLNGFMNLTGFSAPGKQLQ